MCGLPRRPRIQQPLSRCCAGPARALPRNSGRATSDYLPVRPKTVCSIGLIIRPSRIHQPEIGDHIPTTSTRSRSN